MERDNNRGGWPEKFHIISPLDVIKTLGDVALVHLSNLPQKVLSPSSSHFQSPRGAEAMLDASLDCEE